jgi:hypothetical protein
MYFNVISSIITIGQLVAEISHALLPLRDREFHRWARSRGGYCMPEGGTLVTWRITVAVHTKSGPNPVSTICTPCTPKFAW